MKTTELLFSFGLCGLILASVSAAEELVAIDSVEIRTSNCDYCGMTFTGTISVKICGNFGCCYTPWLTGNFDEGNSDFFYGPSELGECHLFPFIKSDLPFAMGMTISHQGTDAGAFDYIRIQAKNGASFECTFSPFLIDDQQ